MLKELVKKENDAIKVVVEKEKQERQAADKEMLAAVSHYSAALQVITIVLYIVRVE